MYKTEFVHKFTVNDIVYCKNADNTVHRGYVTCVRINFHEDWTDIAYSVNYGSKQDSFDSKRVFATAEEAFE